MELRPERPDDHDAVRDLHVRKPSLRLPDGAFQVIRLASYEAWMSGTLVPSEVFWRHDAVGLREPGFTAP